jgi:hypothetical protein
MNYDHHYSLSPRRSKLNLITALKLFPFGIVSEFLPVLLMPSETSFLIFAAQPVYPGYSRYALSIPYKILIGLAQVWTSHYEQLSRESLFRVGGVWRNNQHAIKFNRHKKSKHAQCEITLSGACFLYYSIAVLLDR